VDEGLVGRERVLAAASELLEDAPQARALILEGEAGIGKTTVWRVATERARSVGYRVLACRTAETEISLPFVSLADLLEPVIDEVLVALPAAQRLALESALARVAPTETFGRLAVSRATLAALEHLSRTQPLLLAIDDLQWLDPATQSVLEFAVRRLADAPIRLIVTCRTGLGSEQIRVLDGLPVQPLPIGPLTADQLGQLVLRRFELALARPRLAELHRMTAGNAYYALEIARSLAAHGVPPASNSPLPIPENVALVLRERLTGLAPDVLDLLILAAASPQPTRESLTALTGSTEALDQSMAAGILELDRERARFTHPLLASVIYSGADPARQRAAHRRLAAAAPMHSEDRALHLALASEAPDAAVAAELDVASARAYARGAPASAAELEQHAARLTPEDQPDERLLRLERHAQYQLAAGDTERGRVTLEQLLDAHRAGPRRARIALRLGNVRYLTDDVPAAHALFGDALAHSGDDDRLRAEALQALAFTAMIGGDIPRALEQAQSSLALAERLGDPHALALAACRTALNQFLSGLGVDRELFERAVGLEDQLDELPFEWLPSYAYAGVAVMADDFDTARNLYDRLTEDAITHGDERAVPTLLFAVSELECRVGDWARAARHSAEAVERSRQTELSTVRAWSLYAQALVQAHLGNVDAARAAAEEGLGLAQAAGAVAQTTQIVATLGFLELSLGAPEAAVAHLSPLSEVVVAFGVGEPGVVRFMPNQIEALTALGQLETARTLLARLADRAESLDRISMRAAVARCEAMVAAAEGDFDRARGCLAAALNQHARLQEPFELGRTLLAEGTIERRAKQRAAARRTLTRALELFDSLGAALWAEKAASQLAQIPGRAPADSGLTKSEHGVASLAADGLSNKQIAGRMFITVRTVEAHLTKIYAKLGVRSRGELAARLKRAEQPAEAGLAPSADVPSQ
jgi:ATP/maltotriose-dependent transcriptional regulator MalT